MVPALAVQVTPVVSPVTLAVNGVLCPVPTAAACGLTATEMGCGAGGGAWYEPHPPASAITHNTHTTFTERSDSGFIEVFPSFQSLLRARPPLFLTRSPQKVLSFVFTYKNRGLRSSSLPAILSPCP